MMNNLLKRTTLWVILAVISSVGPQASAAALQCEGVFAEVVAKKPSVVEALNPTIEEFFQQRQAGVPLDQIQFNVTGSVRETLEWMRDQMETVTPLDVATMAPHEGSFIYGEIVKIKTQLKQVTQQRRIAYSDFVELARKFSAGITVKLHGSVGPSQTTILVRELALSGPNPVLTEIASNPKKHDFLFLPLTTALGITSMNALQARDVVVLGLTNRVEVVDGNTYLPFTFFVHDFDHGVIYERQPPRNKLGGLPPYKTLTRAGRMEFHAKFEQSLASAEISARAKKIRTSLWFYIFHENGIPLHPASLEKELRLLENPTSMKLALKRFNDLGDLGHTFKDQRLTQEELTLEINAMVEFARAQQ